jgi:hypothetical protein
MSYDLEFLRKAAEESLATGDDGAQALDADVRAAVTAAVRDILGEITVHEGELYCELDHAPTGIQVNLYRHSAAITVPHRYSGAEATAIVRQIYDLGRIVEQHTGLIGYDPQTELPLAEAAARPTLAAEIFDRTAASIARRGIQ